MNKFEPDYFNWEYLPDTMTIQGLHCQKAVQKFNDEIQTTVWFCPDIPAQAGIMHLACLPGLIVEADFPTYFNRHYALESYTTGVDIPDKIFWPGEFDARQFNQGDEIKKYSSKLKLTEKQIRDKKQQDILKNNQ